MCIIANNLYSNALLAIMYYIIIVIEKHNNGIIDNQQWK